MMQMRLTTILAESWPQMAWQAIVRYFTTLTAVGWVVLVAALGLYVLMSYRVARQMKRVGRGGVRWFWISLFFTAIPAAAVLVWHNFAWLRRGDKGHPDQATRDALAKAKASEIVRCPRCRRRVHRAELNPADPTPTCPRCGSLWDPERLA